MVLSLRKVKFAPVVAVRSLRAYEEIERSIDKMAIENLKKIPNKSCLKEEKRSNLKKLFQISHLSACQKIIKIALLLFIGIFLISYAVYKDYRTNGL